MMGEVGILGGQEKGNVRSTVARRAAKLARALIPLDHIEAVLHRPYLVKNWLDLGNFSVDYGESNVGKTFLVLDLALHIAAGIQWHGARVSDPRQVPCIVNEGRRGVTDRLDAIWREMPDLARAAVGQFSLLSVTMDFCARGDAMALIEMVRNLPAKPGLIIIDALARTIGAGDENTGQDIGAFIASVDAIRAATGAQVMVIHHSGKDTSRGARGHSSLRAAADTGIGLTRAGLTITAEAHKQRDMPGGKAFACTLRGVHLGDDQGGEPITSCVVQPSDAPARRRGPKVTGPKVAGQALVALQALGEALSQYGQTMADTARFPGNRQCLALGQWREWCDRMALTRPGMPKSPEVRCKRLTGREFGDGSDRVAVEFAAAGLGGLAAAAGDGDQVRGCWRWR